MKELIGANAGKVWEYLEKNGKTALKELRKGCKLTERDTYAALGWLSREGKIAFDKQKEDYEVVLVK